MSVVDPVRGGEWVASWHSVLELHSAPPGCSPQMPVVNEFPELVYHIPAFEE